MNEAPFPSPTAEQRAHFGTQHANKPLSRDRLVIQDDTTIEFRGKILTKSTLQEYFEMYRGWAVSPGIGGEWISDDADSSAFVRTLYEHVPLTLHTEPNTRLKAEFKHFPYMIDGELEYCSYALRLIPITGKVNRIELNEAVSVAINSQTMDGKQANFEFGNGSLHFELWFEPTTVNVPIAPCGDFRYRIWLRRSSDNALVQSGDFYYAEPFNDFWNRVETENKPVPLIRRVFGGAKK